MLQKKLCEPLLREARLKSIHYLIFACSWQSLKKSLFWFCNSNGIGVTCICLRCSRCKQDCLIISSAFIRECVSDYRAKAIPLLICQSMVNMLNQIPIMQTGAMAMRIQVPACSFSLVAVQNNVLPLLTVYHFNSKTTHHNGLNI